MSPHHFWFRPLAIKSCFSRFLTLAALLTVADRTEPPGGLCTPPLPPQAGTDGFSVIRQTLLPEIICQARCTVALFCLSECLADSSITDEPELLAWAGLMATFEPRIPAASGHLEYAAHGFDAELSLILFDEDILHFRRLAKYFAAYWRMASTSACSANCGLRRAFSAAVRSPVLRMSFAAVV